MTRDTQRLYDDRDPVNDAEVYAALWAAAPFPRIPEDAPIELKKLTINIDDPKRVYAIHRASRRHYFQILVERYILQIRYGCLSKTCTTTTCFSCRKRLAGGAPVRRYNATSTRTLAVYMASQDNPERGLCHHTRAESPTPPINKVSKLRPSVDGDIKTASRSLDSRKSREDGGNARIITAHTSVTQAAIKEDAHTQTSHRGSLKDEVSTRERRLNLHVLEETTTMDHRSFVQNLFGTVAFKMLEWLTPRNLELLARSEVENKPTPNDNVTLEPSSASENVPRDTSVNESLKTETLETVSRTESKAEDLKPATNQEALPEKSSKPKHKPEISSITDSNTHKSADIKSNTISAPRRRTSSNIRKKSESIESQPAKGILSKPSRTTESATDMIHSQLPKRRLSRSTLITGPKLSVTETNPSTHDLKSLPTMATSEAKPKTIKAEDENAVGTQVSSKLSEANLHKTPQSTTPPKSEPAKDGSQPQSLLCLSLEIIDFLCDVMQSDDTYEKHLLQPEIIDESLKRQRDQSIALQRSPALQKTSGYPSSTKVQWRTFIEQSYFDVLGRPESLLRSFRDENSRLFDSQTMWYLMLRMTRVAPSLVFDSLWNAVGTLFRPPKKLEVTHEWAKEFTSQQALSSHAVSSSDAAQVINICLHALVAAIPLFLDARELANMSRIRSHGLPILGKDSSSLEPATLCLQYEDAFSNDLAMRLARRLFAAIPTRRRFTELLELQNDARNGESAEPDILETILETFKFLDLGTPSVLNFSGDERDLHEKRVTTLILDWARTVMLQEWEGTGEVPSDGPFGGALATIAAIYKNRKSLFLGDIHFRTEYFAERLDQVAMPLDWLAFESNKRTVHLLDYPYLFNRSTLVTYFRAINFSRMNQAYETAKATFGLMHSVMAEHNLMMDKNNRDILQQRLRTAHSKFMLLRIRRDNVLLDTFNCLWRREERELMRPLKVRLGEYAGEEGDDYGGVQQEFFRLAIAEALDPDYGTFTIDDRTKMTWFQPGSPEPTWKFELIGMIVSLAVYNGLTLPITFPKALYRKLLGKDVTELHHIADGWPDLANGLTTLLEWDEKDGAVEDIFARTYEFSVEQFGQPVSREMGTSTHWPQFSDLQTPSSNPDDAPLVTNENRNSYVSDYIRWLTDISIQPQFDAFKAGFFACIDRRSITLLDPSTLQEVVEGIQDIDISDLRRATRYVGWDASNRTVRDFWSIVKKYDLEQKKKLLEFVTASDRVPVGGTRNLMFILQRNGVGDERLPTSATCFGTLLLPQYSSKELMREKLAMALENSKGFGNA